MKAEDYNDNDNNNNERFIENCELFNVKLTGRNINFCEAVYDIPPLSSIVDTLLSCGLWWCGGVVRRCSTSHTGPTHTLSLNLSVVCSSVLVR